MPKIFINTMLIGLLLLSVILCPQYSIAATTTGTVNVSAVVLSKSKCSFTNPGTATLDFGTLNPLSATDVTVNATLEFTCRGSSKIATFNMSDDDGLHESGVNAPRMQHATNPAEYLPYSFSMSPSSGTAPKNAAQTLTVTGTLLGADYQSAIAGVYSDLVVISIQP